MLSLFNLSFHVSSSNESCLVYEKYMTSCIRSSYAIRDVNFDVTSADCQWYGQRPRRCNALTSQSSRSTSQYLMIKWYHKKQNYFDSVVGEVAGYKSWCWIWICGFKSYHMSCDFSEVLKLWPLKYSSFITEN